MIFWVLGVILLSFIIMTIYYYNRFVILENRIKNALSQIDVQLKRRHDLLPKLVAVVKGYAKHEKNVFTEITKARAAVSRAKDIGKKLEKSQELSNLVSRLLLIAENYPELKANENFLQLQQEISDLERKIAYTRQFFNDSVLAYNTSVLQFPGVVFAKMFNKEPKNYLKLETSNVEIKF